MNYPEKAVIVEKVSELNNTIERRRIVRVGLAKSCPPKKKKCPTGRKAR